MKRLAAFLLTLLLIVCPAAAERAFEDYAASLAALYGSEWKEQGDIRVLNVVHGASTISVCLRGEDVATVTVEAVQDGSIEEIAANALEGLSLLSGEALTAVAELDAGEEMRTDGCVIGRLAGESRECVYFAAEADFESLLWEPVHGGDQLHLRPDCSGMDVPRLITPEAATVSGYDFCDHCAKSAQTE